MCKVIQFVSILPVEGEVHKVLDEVPVEDMPKACRLKLVVEKD